MAHVTNPVTHELKHFTVACFEWNDHTAAGLDEAFLAKVTEWLPPAVKDAGLDVDDLTLVLNVDGASANKFDGLGATMLTCVLHRWDTTIKHVLDATLPNASAAAKHIQQRVHAQLEVARLFRASGKLRYVMFVRGARWDCTRRVDTYHFALCVRPVNRMRTLACQSRPACAALVRLGVLVLACHLTVTTPLASLPY